MFYCPSSDRRPAGEFAGGAGGVGGAHSAALLALLAAAAGPAQLLAAAAPGRKVSTVALHIYTASVEIVGLPFRQAQSAPIVGGSKSTYAIQLYFSPLLISAHLLSDHCGSQERIQCCNSLIIFLFI